MTFFLEDKINYFKKKLSLLLKYSLLSRLVRCFFGDRWKDEWFFSNSDKVEHKALMWLLPSRAWSYLWLGHLSHLLAGTWHSLTDRLTPHLPDSTPRTIGARLTDDFRGPWLVYSRDCLAQGPVWLSPFRVRPGRPSEPACPSPFSLTLVSWEKDSNSNEKISTYIRLGSCYNKSSSELCTEYFFQNLSYFGWFKEFSSRRSWVGMKFAFMSKDFWQVTLERCMYTH